MRDPAAVPNDHPCPIADDSLAPAPPSESVVSMLSAVLAGEFDRGYVLAFYDLNLRHVTVPGRGNVWEVYVATNREPVAVLNVSACRSASALHAVLCELQADLPNSYGERAKAGDNE